MEQPVCTFRRVEKKYCISKDRQAVLLAEVADRLVPDSHGKSTVCSLYLDTPTNLLIRSSIDAGAYKEKLRLRSYGISNPGDPVFLEIKKKYKGVVYKRRVQVPLSRAMEYIRGGDKPCTGQIMEEIDYAMRFYGGLCPAMFIACEREAYFCGENPGLRLTFDTAIRFRRDALELNSHTGGEEILPQDKVLLEIKTDGAMPLWLSEVLNRLEIYPTRFSKYATAYGRMIKTEGAYDHA